MGSVGHDLDSVSLKAADRAKSGLPPTFCPEMQYGYARREDMIVCVPVRLRTRTPIPSRSIGLL
jgi:hypothetical protein